LKRVHVEGFAVEQVWEQVRRVVAAAEKEVGRAVERLEEVDADDSQPEEEDELEADEENVESDIGEEGVDGSMTAKMLTVSTRMRKRPTWTQLI